MSRKAFLIGLGCLSAIIVVMVAIAIGYSYQAAAPSTTVKDSGTEKRAQSKGYNVYVYFSQHPDSDSDPSKVVALLRTSGDSGVATYAIQELLKGPNSTEATEGFFRTAALRPGPSNCGGPDFKLAISHEVATLQFCRKFDHLGVMSDAQAESQIKATLTQFASVKKVIILSTTGNCEFDLSGTNQCKK